MNRFTFLFFLISGILCFSSPATAQQQEPTALLRLDDAPIRFEHLTNADGLSQQSVYSIVQDRQGFMWFGTQMGLNKYDGHTFTVYEYEQGSPSGPGSSSPIRSIYEDSQGMLWIGYDNRRNPIDRFDPAIETFTRYRHNPESPVTPSAGEVLDILEDRDGVLWFAGWGLNRFDPGTGTFTHILPDPRFLTYEAADEPENLSNWINALHEDRFGTLWVGTEDGLFRYDRTRERFTVYRHDPDDSHSLSHDHVKALYEDGEDTLWVGTEVGLNRFDRAAETFERFYPDPRYLTGTANSAAGYVNAASSILEDRTGSFWIGTDGVILEGPSGDITSSGGGLLHFDRVSGVFTSYRHVDSDPHSLIHNSVNALYEDRQGMLWISTNAGVDRTDLTTPLIPLYPPDPESPEIRQGGSVNAIFLARDGALWTGTTTGLLSRFDRTTGSYTHYWHDPSDATSLSPGTIREIYEDSRGRIWVGHYGYGVSRLDPPSASGQAPGHFKRFRHDTEDSTSLGGDRILAIYEDHKGTIWIGGHDTGLNRFEPETETFRRVQPGGEDAMLVSPISIAAFHEDREGRLWMNSGLNPGPISFDPQTETFEIYPVEVDNSGWSFVERAEEPGVFWNGSSTSGTALARFDVRTRQVTFYTRQNSDMPGNTVYCVLDDDQGNLWVSTNQGLVRFNPDTGQFRTFGLEDGLQDLQFGGDGCHRGHTGEFFFGGVNGINVFYPDQIGDNPYPPEVALTGLRLFNEPVVPGPGSPLETNIAMAKAITLRYHQNDVTFDYVGLHFSNPAKNQYQYILEGNDDAWREVGTLREATYTNLPPGDYTFRVKASNSGGVWNEEGASLALTIQPPWWLTWWAYLSYGLLLVTTIFAADRLQRRRVLRKERQQSFLREKELRADAAEAMANYLQSENLRQTQELDAARDLQLSMLPQAMPAHPTVELAAFMETATEVGGDYYDFNLAEDGTLTLAIGDATGHGTKAGTMVTATKSLWHAFSGEPDLAVVLQKSSRALKQMGLPKLYMALALARLRDHTLELAGAGMPPALVYRAATQQVETVALKGMPLGGPGAVPYSKTSVPLSPGDTVVLMSDGFPELFNAEGEMLGYDRVVTVFEEVAAQSPEAIIEHFKATASTWMNGRAQDDDVTFLVMRVKEGWFLG